MAAARSDDSEPAAKKQKRNSVLDYFQPSPSRLSTAAPSDMAPLSEFDPPADDFEDLLGPADDEMIPSEAEDNSPKEEGDDRRERATTTHRKEEVGDNSPNEEAEDNSPKGNSMRTPGARTDNVDNEEGMQSPGGKSNTSQATILPPLWEQRIQALIAKSCDTYMAAAIGMPLTEENVGALQAWFNQEGSKVNNNTGEFSPETLAPADKKEYERLAAVEKTKLFDTRSYLGQQFRDYVDNDKQAKKDFADCKNRKEQNEFRLQWAAKKLNQFRESKVFKRSWNRVDTTQGTYWNFSRVVQEFGGWKCQEAIDGAVTACNKCLAMGYPWVMRHPQSNLVTFLILEIKFAENFEQSWAHFQQEFEAGTLEEQQASSGKTNSGQLKSGKQDSGKQGSGEPASGKQASGKQASGKQASGKAKAKGKAQPKKSPQKEIDPKDMSTATLWREGLKLKASFQSASCVLMEIEEKIRTQDAWKWAKGDRKEKLEEVQRSVKTLITPWQQDFFMASDMTAFKKQHSSAKLELEMQAMLTKLAKPIKGMVDFCKNTQEAHITLSD